MEFREFKAQVQADLTPSGLWHDELVMYFSSGMTPGHADTGLYSFNNHDIDIAYAYDTNSQLWTVADKLNKQSGTGTTLQEAYEDLNRKP